MNTWKVGIALCACFLSVSQAVQQEIVLAQVQREVNRPLIYDQYVDFDLLQQATQANRSRSRVPQAPASPQSPKSPAAPAAKDSPFPEFPVRAVSTQKPAVSGPRAEAYLQITQIPVPLEGRVRAKYQAMRITVRNLQGTHVEILRGEITNGVDGYTAYKEVEAAARYEGTARHVVRSNMDYVPYMGFGNVAVAHSGRTFELARNERDAEATMGKVKYLPATVLGPQDSVSVVTLIPQNQSAQVRVVFRDMKSNEVFSIGQ